MSISSGHIRKSFEENLRTKRFNFVGTFFIEGKVKVDFHQLISWVYFITSLAVSQKKSISEATVIVWQAR